MMIEACKIIREHNKMLKDDPDRLTTDFLTSLVLVKPEHRMNYLKKERQKYRFNPEENWKEP
jgi:hypothetical protein